MLPQVWDVHGDALCRAEVCLEEQKSENKEKACRGVRGGSAVAGPQAQEKGILRTASGQAFWSLGPMVVDFGSSWQSASAQGRAQGPHVLHL